MDAIQRASYRYTATRANGTSQRGWFDWPNRAAGHAEFVVQWLMRNRYNRATVTLDGIEVGWITQDRPGGQRQASWDESA